RAGRQPGARATRPQVAEEASYPKAFDLGRKLSFVIVATYAAGGSPAPRLLARPQVAEEASYPKAFDLS
ncbi:MAG: hypothetical protein ABIP75_16250, partial [Pyrinomonadaceae bacterium]